MNNNIISQPIKFSNSTVSVTTNTLLNNGNVLISYRDNHDLGKGKLHIVRFG